MIQKDNDYLTFLLKKKDAIGKRISDHEKDLEDLTIVTRTLNEVYINLSSAKAELSSLDVVNNLIVSNDIKVQRAQNSLRAAKKLLCEINGQISARMDNTTDSAKKAEGAKEEKKEKSKTDRFAESIGNAGRSVGKASADVCRAAKPYAKVLWKGLRKQGGVLAEAAKKVGENASDTGRELKAEKNRRDGTHES